VSGSQTPDFFAPVCRERILLHLPPFASLPARLSIYLPCHYEQLHLATAATMGKRKPSDAEVEEVQAKNTKKSKVSINIGMCARSYFL
jgi:hypothetical protein